MIFSIKVSFVLNMFFKKTKQKKEEIWTGSGTGTEVTFC